MSLQQSASLQHQTSPAPLSFGFVVHTSGQNGALSLAGQHQPLQAVLMLSGPQAAGPGCRDLAGLGFSAPWVAAKPARCVLDKSEINKA